MTKAYFKRGHGEGVNMNFFKPNFFTSGLQRGKAQTIHEKAFLYRGQQTQNSQLKEPVQVILKQLSERFGRLKIGRVKELTDMPKVQVPDLPLAGCVN